MFTIEKASYGIKMSMNGLMHEGETSWWVKEFSQALQKLKPGFKLFIDMRGLKPFTKEAIKDVHQVHELLLRLGIERSVLLLDHPITTMQCKRIARQSGMHEKERYLQAPTEPDWEKKVAEWLERGIDPA